MGEEVSQRLELEPLRFFVRVEKRPKLGCQRCKEGVAAAPAGETPLPGALPGPGLLAQLLVGKYRDGLPLHRQQAIFDKRHGVRLPASTLGDWVAGASDLLSPVVALLKQRTLADALLHTDDTGVRVLDRDDARGVKRGHLWPYVGQGGNVFVEYTPDWSGRGPQGVLADFRGYLVVDGYKGYQAFFGPTSARIEVGCRVGGGVTAPTPHSPGRADFPHPVLHGAASLAAAYRRRPRLVWRAVPSTVTMAGELRASLAIRACFVDTLSGFKAPSVFPTRGSATVTPPFPRTGPREPGSPPSAVLRGRYDFPCPLPGRSWFRCPAPHVAPQASLPRAGRRRLARGPGPCRCRGPLSGSGAWRRMGTHRFLDAPSRTSAVCSDPGRAPRPSHDGA